jgi:8-oxo-dGTP pyrophosphatase MutT (NUDIX family)
VSEDFGAPRQSVSVAAAVLEADRAVVRRRDTGRWEPPGGVLERGESIPEDSCQRRSNFDPLSPGGF